MNSPKVSIGIDFLAVPADTVTKESDATKFSIVAACVPGVRLITTSFKSKSNKSPDVCLWYCHNKVIWSVFWPPVKLNILAGFAVLPIIDLLRVAVTPLIVLFNGVTRKKIEFVSLLVPLFMPETVNLILPSSSTPVAGTFTVLNAVKSAPPSSPPTSSTLSNR